MNNIKSRNNKAMPIVTLFIIVIATIVAFGLTRTDKAFAHKGAGNFAHKGAGNFVLNS